MSTDYQQAREALGARLRELRYSAPDGRLTGTALARALGWPNSKISKLELGKQTATPEDLRAWADACGRPESYQELRARLAGFESHIRSWRRQLVGGHAPVQNTHNEAQARASVLRAWESSWIVGVIGLDTVEIGIVPFTAPLKQPPGVGFWIYDDQQVIVETWHAELWLDDADTVATHVRVWEALRASAVYGAEAHRVIARARQAIG